MAHDPDRTSTHRRIIAALVPIIGLKLSASYRALDMRIFEFASSSMGSDSACEFAIHIQCPWRIEGPDGIVTGRMDLWEPVDANLTKRDNAIWDYDASPNEQDVRLNKWFAQFGSSLVIENVDADDYGGSTISFVQDFRLRLFPAGKS